MNVEYLKTKIIHEANFIQGVSHEVIVQRVISPYEIYVCRVSDLHQLNNFLYDLLILISYQPQKEDINANRAFQREINEFYENEENQEHLWTPEEGVFCMVKSSSSWNRGLILKNVDNERKFWEGNFSIC